jgi:2'-5' RNA ligase
MRVFAALRPPPPVLEHLDAAVQEVRALSGPGLRWGDPGQWHLTLAFDGDLPEGAVDAVLADLEALCREHAPLELELRGAGSFSGRTLWAGGGGQTRPLTALMSAPLLGGAPVGVGGAARAGAVGAARAESDGGGRGRERRRAHLTLARVSAKARRPRPRRRRGEEPAPDPTRLLLEEAVRALSVYRGPSWRAQEVELLASYPGQGRSGGPLHELLGAVPLGG